MKKMNKNHYFFKRFNLVLWVLSILLLFLGCAAMTHTLTGKDPGLRYSPTTKEQIKIYFSSDIGHEYAEIGYVAVEKGNNPEVAKDLLKEEAAKLGADAIINFQIGLMARDLNFFGATEGVVSVKGIAVKFK
jgi:hypothetical protein